PPVLTDYIDLSIAGTLSVGGVGGQSFRHGLQLDNVLELVTVTGAGEVVRCSPARDAALFDACLGGLGQFGVIVEATVRLVAAPVEVRVFELAYDDLATFLRAQLALVEDGRFDYVLGNFARSAEGSGLDAWRYSIECVHYVGAGGAAGKSDAELLAGLDFSGEPARRTQGYFDYANRLAAMVTEMKRAGTWHGAHPWIDLFLPASQAAPLIAATLTELSHDDVAAGYVMTYPLLRRRCRTSFPGLPGDEQLFLFDVLPSFAAAQSASLSAFVAKCDRLVARAHAAGATVYPIGFPVATADMRAADWRRQLGPAYEALARLQRQVDPEGILRRGLDIFP
ncbi:MAG: oxygen-dependent FAD-linked oxidoreductase, partial [bacterium]|nr:oxygen-dependent FAD-linked oxidoreductase [bacterium]